MSNPTAPNRETGPDVSDTTETQDRPLRSGDGSEVQAQHFVFAWRRGEKPRLFGPFRDVYAANRQLRRYDAMQGYYTWVVQPEPGAES